MTQGIDIQSILVLLQGRPGGASAVELHRASETNIPLRTFRRRLEAMVKEGYLRQMGRTRGTRYLQGTNRQFEPVPLEGRIQVQPSGQTSLTAGEATLPLEVPQLLEECLFQILHTAEAIEDPFEQAFFLTVHLPYLQPFVDVNKRTARLAANIPFIRRNLCPLSFADVPVEAYTEGILGVYEFNRIALLRDVFVWAYERSCAKYTAVRESIGEPDPFKLRHRAAIKEIIAAVIKSAPTPKSGAELIHQYAQERLPKEERIRFQATVEAELAALHEGNFARYRVRPSEFEAWRSRWK